MLYGWLEPDNDDLVLIDVLTGAASVVGDSGLTTNSGIAYSIVDDLVYLAGESDDGNLRRIDPDTGGVRSTQPLVGGSGNGYEIVAMDFDLEGDLYAVRTHDNAERQTDLLRINTQSGEIEELGRSADGLRAIAFCEVCQVLSGGTPTPTPEVTKSPTKAGDCDGNGTVSIEEIIIGVAIVVGDLDLGTCPELDINGDGMITVDEIVVAIEVALRGRVP